MATTSLTGKQRRYLRGLGNQVRPSVYLGYKGLNDEGVRSLNEAFANNELVKIKLQENFPADRFEAGERLAALTHSQLVQVLGRTILLYRADPDEPKIVLP